MKYRELSYSEMHAKRRVCRDQHRWSVLERCLLSEKVTVQKFFRIFIQLTYQLDDHEICSYIYFTSENIVKLFHRLFQAVSKNIFLMSVILLKHPQVLVTADANSDESYQLKEMVRSVGTGLIREKMAQYIKELKQGTLDLLHFIFNLL